jgi:type I site-specific restriction endonuclease
MRSINEDEAELLIEEPLRAQGWNLPDFTLTRKRWREHLNGEEADRVLLHEGKIGAILEAQKPGKDLWAALDQAKHYARTYKKNTGAEGYYQSGEQRSQYGPRSIILVGVGMLDTGIDAPDVEVLLMARPTKSKDTVCPDEGTRDEEVSRDQQGVLQAGGFRGYYAT